MTNVIDFEQFKFKKLGQASFQLWNVQFKQSFDFQTTLADLPDRVLLFLASPGDKSTGAIYQLAEKIRFPKSKTKASLDEKKIEMDLMDIHLYFLDKIRLEIMKRLKWLDTYDDIEMPILELILKFDKESSLRSTPPELSSDHPRIDEYNELITKEKELFIRKLSVNALIEFNHKVHG